MTSLYVDLEDVDTAVSDYIFSIIPVQQFDTQEVNDMVRGPVLNSKTNWDVIPLRGDLCKIIADKFMVGRVTNPGAQVFVDAAALSLTQLTGLFNLIVEAVQPTWVTDLPGSPLPKLVFDSTFSIVEEQTRFSLEADVRFCQFMKVFMHKNLAKAIYILFEEDISAEAKVACVATETLAMSPPPAPLAHTPAAGFGVVHGGTMVHRVQLDEKVSGPDRALVAEHDQISPDRVESMLNHHETAKILTDSFTSRSTKDVKARLKELKPDYAGGTGLDVDGNLSHANLFRVLCTDSLYGKGDIAQELRELCASRARTIAEKYYLSRIKIGTPLVVRVSKFGVELGKFKYSTYAHGNDVMDMIMGPDLVSSKDALPIKTEHDLKFVIEKMTAIFSD